MAVRPARLTDAEPVWHLLTQLAVSFAAVRHEFDALYPALVDDDRMLLQVAEVDGRVRGYALTAVSPLLHVGGESAQLQELVVDSEHRGAGLGTQLLGAVEAECRARGVRQLVVASRRAADFYSARGYTTSADYLKRVL